MSKQALGRGFEGLIPTGFSVTDVATPGEQIKQVDTAKVFPNPDQPRKEFDIKALNELAQSIKEYGIIQPLVVTETKDGYRIVAGERRWRASTIAKLSKVPVIIRNHKELEELEIALVENVQRVDLSPLETAVSIIKLRDQFSLSITEIATKLGKAETTISNILRLLHLPKEAIEALQKNLITEGHGRAILALKTDEKLQLELLNKIITQKLSVRQAENFVIENRSQNSTKSLNLDDKTVKFINELKPEIKNKIKIGQQSKSGKGTVIIKYSSLDELRKITDIL